MKCVTLGILAMACGISILWTEPWIEAPQAVAKKALTEAEIRSDIQYQANLRAAKAVLNKKGCGEKIPAYAAQAAIRNHIPARIVAADIVVESGCRTNAKSKAGAIGLMQVMGSIYRVPRKRLLNPKENVNIGTRILAQKIHKYGYRGGLARYFGLTPGSSASAVYATKVLNIAYREKSYER